jgi:hypothetical protein
MPVPLTDMAASPELHFVKTHDLPSEDRHPALYLVRDGRDALVSYAHYILSFEAGHESGPRQTAFPEVLRDLIIYKASFGGWGPNVLAWTRGRSAPVRVIKFEALIADPVRELVDAVRGLGCELRPRNASRLPTFQELHETMPAFFRRGNVGCWQDEMSPELHQLFWEHHGEAMSSMGYAKCK